MKRTTILAAIAVTGTAVAALAHSGATGVVKERMEAMKAMGDAVKAVTPMMQGEVAYDADVMRKTARTFQAHSGEAMTKLFPEGSMDMPSEVKESVWSDWDRFAALAEQLGIYAKGLEGAAGNDPSGGGGNMGAGSMMSGGSMMGSGMMGTTMSSMMSADDIAAMPVDAAFTMTTQVCSACHERFRAEDD